MAKKKVVPAVELTQNELIFVTCLRKIKETGEKVKELEKDKARVAANKVLNDARRKHYQARNDLYEMLDELEPKKDDDGYDIDDAWDLDY